MRSVVRFGALGLTASLLFAACSGGSASPSASASESAEASAAASSGAAECTAATMATLKPGTLTIGTDNPAYPPYFAPPAEGDPTAPWELGDPTNGDGFEAAVAYAIAGQLGYKETEVAWTVVPFDTSYAPGPKTFDIDINQISFTADRAETVDMTDGYYYLSQAVVALADTPITKVTTIADLKGYKLGAMQGTTSYETITEAVMPTAKASVYNTNDAAIQALKAKQIDGIVVDLPTAFYMTAAQLDNGVIVGQFPTAGGQKGEHFSVVLAKDSPLTVCINKAIAALKADGTLAGLEDKWLAQAGAPVFGQ